MAPSDPNPEPTPFKGAQPLGEAPTMGPGLRGLDGAEIRPPRGLPPVHAWNPPHCGPIDMRIAADGTWHYMGTPIVRPAMVRLFSTILRREPDGEYVLVTPVERVGITVDDAPFIAVALRVEDGGRRLVFTTNVGDETEAGPEHAIRVATDPVTGQPAPYVHVRAGLEARLSRAVFYELVDLGIERDGRLIVTSLGVDFDLGSLS